MREQQTFSVIEGGKQELDLKHIYEEMDAVEALIILRRHFRQTTPAANASLAVVSLDCQEVNPEPRD